MRKLHNNLFAKLKSDLLWLSFLGLLCGIFAGSAIVAFRYIIEYCQQQFLPGANPENYEALSSWLIFLIPLAGGLLIGAIFHFLPSHKRQTGLVHTVEAMRSDDAKLPLANTAAQFIGAAISIIAGHSVGREGPSIHIGATSGNIIARFVRIPVDSTRILMASGAAGAIAASFNTPIAGVIFALEVLLHEYATKSMIPIIMASLAATLISNSVFGGGITLDAPSLSSNFDVNYVGILITGISIGLISVIFIRLLVSITVKSQHHPIFLRLTLAGAITGLLALIAPEIMSIGYDTVVDTFENKIVLVSLLVILILKILATTIGLGLGLPGGLIGPSLVIGALSGSAIGLIMAYFFPDSGINPGMYAMIGMGAMMAATLQAPLAALIAIFELTLNPHIILPGLIAIVAASLTCSELLRQPSVITALSDARKNNL